MSQAWTASNIDSTSILPHWTPMRTVSRLEVFKEVRKDQHSIDWAQSLSWKMLMEKSYGEELSTRRAEFSIESCLCF